MKKNALTTRRNQAVIIGWLGETEVFMGKILIVIDMQNDFVTGALGSEEAKKIVPAVVDKVKNYDGDVIFTRDTHGEDYMQTQEGKNLPVPHCIKGTDGWQIIPELLTLQQEKNCKVFDKPTFGSTELAEYIKNEYEKGNIDEVELIGVCTDICVVSNAMLIKANAPELPVSVTAGCCAGVTPQKHDAALETMQSCQIKIM